MMTSEPFSLVYLNYFAFALVCITTLGDWFKKLAPLPKLISSKTNTNRDSSHAFSRVSRRIHVLALRFDTEFDCFNGLSASSVIGLSNNFGFHDTQLKPAIYKLFHC